MIDHTSLNVSDYAKSKAFYMLALAPIGYEIVKEPTLEQTHGVASCGMGENNKPDFWLTQGKAGSPVHLAFGVKSCALVDAFYKAAIAAGGTDNGAPGVRDPDGHNIEVVCHRE